MKQVVEGTRNGLESCPPGKGKESRQPGALRLDALGVLGSYSWNCEVGAHPQPTRSKVCTAGLFCCPPHTPTRSKCCLRQNPSVPAGLEHSVRQVSKDGKTIGEAGLASGLSPGLFHTCLHLATPSGHKSLPCVLALR